nr:unnamed protein product [Spirometra erinaceieuropaei]
MDDSQSRRDPRVRQLKQLEDFFVTIKAIEGPIDKEKIPLLTAEENTLLAEKTQILQRCAGHIRGDLNRPLTSPMLPPPVSQKWRPTSTSTSRSLCLSLFTKPSVRAPGFNRESASIRRDPC